MADMGIEGDAGVMQRNPNMMAEAMRRSRPQEPKAEAEPKTLKAADGYTYWISGPEKGQRVVPGANAPEAPEPEGTNHQGSGRLQLLEERATGRTAGFAWGRGLQRQAPRR